MIEQTKRKEAHWFEGRESNKLEFYNFSKALWHRSDFASKIWPQDKAKTESLWMCATRFEEIWSDVIIPKLPSVILRYHKHQKCPSRELYSNSNYLIFLSGGSTINISNHMISVINWWIKEIFL